MDVERCFGVLQSQWKIYRHENRRWDKEEVLLLSEACEIIHNMLVTLINSDRSECDGDEDIISDPYEE